MPVRKLEPQRADEVLVFSPGSRPVLYAVTALIVHTLCITQITSHIHLAPVVLPWIAVVSAVASVLVGVFAARFSYATPFGVVWVLDAFASLVPLLLIWALQSDSSEVRRDGFGFLLAGMTFLKAGGLILCLTGIHRRGGAVRARHVFLVTLVFYIAATPWAASDVRATGDEPHYLLLAHSLMVDGDFDLRNNYERKHYRAFDMEELGHHGVVNERGELLMWHDVGTSLLIYPGYKAAGRLGAMVVMNIAAAALGAAVYVLGLQLGSNRLAALLCAFVFALAPPLVYYSSEIYPEVPGAACCAIAAVAFNNHVRTGRWVCLLAAGASLAVLPWLSIRFWTLVAGVFVVVLCRLLLRLWRAATPPAVFAAHITAFVLPLVVSLINFGLFDIRHFGTWLPNAGYLAIRSSYPQFWLRPHIALSGMLLDRSYGLLPLAPAYLLVGTGLLRSAMARWESAVLLAPAVAYIGFMSLSQQWHGGWCPPARYILIPALLLTPFAAAVITDKRIRVFTLFAVTWTLLASVLLTALPLNGIPSLTTGRSGGGFLYLAYRFGVDIGLVFPAMLREELNDYFLAGCWLFLIAVVLWWTSASSIRTSWGRKLALAAVAFAAIGFSGRFVYLRQTNAMFRQQIVSSVREFWAETGSTFEVPVLLTNTGYLRWTAVTTHPVNLSYRWVSEGVILPGETLRTQLAEEIVYPGQTMAMNLKVMAPEQPGVYELRVTLVKEGVAWFMTQSGEYLAIPVTVQTAR